MPPSPSATADGIVIVKIEAGGTALPREAILAVEVTRAANRIPSARITLLDDSDVDGSQRFALSDGDLLKPGAAIEIKAGYDAPQDTIFKGIVVRHGVRIGPFGRSRLVLECRDQAVKMTVGRKCANYVDSKDSDIIAKIASAYGLDATVEATTVTHKELVQYDVSDWDFLLARAEANGRIVLLDGGNLTVAPPATSGEAVLAVHYGEDLYAFDGDVDARHQFASVSSTAWDPATQDVVAEQADPKALNGQGNLAAAALADVIGLSALRLQSTTPLDAEGLKAWTAARQLKAGLARVRGRMRFRGSALAQPDTVVHVSGAGKRFEGNAWLSAVTHMIGDGDWVTDAEFGMAPETLAERLPLAAPLAGGLTAGVSGLQIGVVMKLDEDPAQQYRVQVSLPVTQAETAGVWARLAHGYGTSGAGHFFVPEVGDEVLLGFLDSDPSHPVILGSLYSSKRKPAYEPAAANNTKAIVTRAQLKIEFDEEKKVIVVTTPGNNKITLSDDAKSIELHDQNDNKVTLSPSGIALDSPKDITLTAKGKIALSATGDVTVDAKGDLKQTAMNVTSTANAGFTAKGTASAELSASGTTTIKGAMVMIN